MKWPWRRCKPDPEDRVVEARKARRESERKAREAHQRWPEVRAARDDLARLAERAMRGTW